MNTPHTRAGVVQALAELGDTEDRMAARLQELGVRGVPGLRHQCALYNWLHGLLTSWGLTPDYWSCYVDPRSMQTPFGPIYPDEVPQHVWRFIDRFDRGRYKNLQGVPR